MHRLRGVQIGMIFQEPVAALNPVFSLEAQITAAVRAHAPMTRRRERDRAVELLGMVGIPDAGRRLGFYPHQLSGGLCQRAMIAMALAGGARLLIADEPTTSLDVTIQQEIVELIERLARETGHGGAVHQPRSRRGGAAVRPHRRRLCGRVLELGVAAALLRAPAHPYTAALVRCVPDLKEIGVLHRGIPALPRCREPGRRGAGLRRVARWAPRPAKIRNRWRRWRGGWCAAGRRGKRRRSQRRDGGRAVAPTDAAPLIEVRDLSVTYRQGFGRSVAAVAGVSFEIARGRTLALIGESGSGKSTVARAICGFVPPGAGTSRSTALPSTGRNGRGRSACRWCRRIPAPRSIRAGRCGAASWNRGCGGFRAIAMAGGRAPARCWSAWG